jgi:hypothetical protein
MIEKICVNCFRFFVVNFINSCTHWISLCTGYDPLEQAKQRGEMVILSYFGKFLSHFLGFIYALD